MEDRAIGLVILAVNDVYFKPWYTPEQVCFDDFYCDVHEVLHGRRRSLRCIPFGVHLTTNEASNMGARTVVLQVLDSSALFVGDTKFQPHQPGRHLFELQVVAWISNREPDDVVMQPDHFLHRLTDDCLLMILDRSFEVSSMIDQRAKYLAMVMSWSRYKQLEMQSMILKNRLKEELDDGFQISFGLSMPEARENQKVARKAESAGRLVFGPLQFASFSLQPVLDFEDALPFLKRFAFSGYPRPLDIIQELGKTSLRMFLRPS